MKRIVTVFCLILLCCIVFCGCSKKKVSTSINLIDAINIDNLYGGEFVYNGITEINQENKTYSIRYDSSIKVGVDASKISIDVDESNKTVKVTIPEIQILNIAVDPDSLKYIPSKPNLQIKDVITRCEEDARNEAQAETLTIDENTTMLSEIAEDNICSFLRAVISPLLEDKDYVIDFYRTKATFTSEVIR